MKTLTDYITEKLIVNKDYKTPDVFDFDDPNIKQLYFIRLMPQTGLMYVDKMEKVMLDHVVNKEDKQKYEVTGKVILSDFTFTRSLFNYDSRGLLYRWNTAFEHRFDMLIHPECKKIFQEFIRLLEKYPNADLYIDEIFSTLDIDCEDVPNEVHNHAYVLPEFYQSLIRNNMFKTYFGL